MKNTIFLSFILFTSISFAQTHRFFYELIIRKPTDTLTINMILDIDQKMTKFYDEEFLTIDSLNRSTKSELQTKSESDQLLIRETNSSFNNQYHSHTYDYYIIKSNDEMKWRLEDETKKIKNITLQKASTSFGGRTWIAWFDSNIPLQEGPYKFNGLPGLIYEIYDSQNLFHYSLVKNKNLPIVYNTNNFLETHYGKKPILVSHEQYQKVKLDYYNNIVEILKEFLRKGGSIASEDDLSSSEEIEQKRKSLQRAIKKNYFPLEVDKAIPYPKN
ncbi:GLPGLI family protein [Riemerella columbina]|uniref:GLPGLI family protein n=1 Tax=Riemerella columbina TaxID=103810 RepID=UPI0003A574AE|nr:GLPGLI family protein [Riemerella columbina]